MHLYKPPYRCNATSDYVHQSSTTYRCYTALVTAPPKPPAPQTQLLFKYLGGDAILDLVNTVDWTPRVLANERLTNYGRLTEWAEGAGLLSSAAVERLRAASQSRPREARNAVTRARWLRAVLQRLYAGLAGGTLEASGWDDFNAELADALRHLEVGRQQSRRKGASRPAGRGAFRRAGWMPFCGPSCGRLPGC